MSRVLTYTVAALLSLAVGAHAGTIQNGDFETGDLSGWNVVGTIDVAVFDLYGNNGATFAARAAGSASLDQGVALEAGTSYFVSWEQAMQNTGPDKLTETGDLALHVGTDLVGLWSQGVSNPGEVSSLLEQKQFTVPSSGVYDVRFDFTNLHPGVVNMYIDNVTLVPEVSAMLLVAAVGMFLVVLRVR